MNTYKKLIVWQKAMELTVQIYTITENFPQEEKYNLTSQMRRASVSLPSNIAEGSLRGSQKAFRQFLLIDFGSGAELETQIEIAKRLPHTSNLQYQSVDVFERSNEDAQCYDF